MNIEVFKYNSGYESGKIYGGFPLPIKETMAEIYREAFGNYPWFERWLCLNCDLFLKSQICGSCGNTTNQEAYPTQTLIENYFPEMLSSFVPGMLGLASNGGQLLGFTTGGLIDLDELIDKKYKSNTIYNSITRYFELSGQEDVFYDNETCIFPRLQQQGAGKELSSIRIETAVSMNADLICGRTINKPWLELKERQFKKAGYNFSYAVPDGDTYQVDGNPRYFYLAQKK